jgi:hypothetical protein
MREGIELAQGEREPQLQVLFEDDRSADKSAALSAAHKLVHQDNVDLVYSWTSATMPVIRSVTRQREIPLIIGSYDQATFSKVQNTHSLFVNYDLIATEMAEALITRHKRKRLALITSTDTWSEGFVAPFTSYTSNNPGVTIEQIKLSPHDTDLRTVVTMLKKKGIDGIAAPLYGAPLHTLLRELYRFKRRSSEGVDTAEELIIHVADGIFKEDLTELGDAAEGVLASQVWLDSPTFLNRYRAQFHRTLTPTELGLVAEGYDLYVLVRSIEEKLSSAKPISTQPLHFLLRTAKIEGLLGPIALSSPPTTSGHRQVIVRNRSFHLLPFPRDS